MTLRHHGRRFKWHNERGNADTLPWRPLMQPTRQGIARRTQKPRPKLPLSDTHETVLAALAYEGARPVDVERATGLSHSAVQSALYALSARVLATRTGGGWVRTDPPNDPTGAAA